MLFNLFKGLNFGVHEIINLFFDKILLKNHLCEFLTIKETLSIYRFNSDAFVKGHLFFLSDSYQSMNSYNMEGGFGMEGI